MLNGLINCTKEGREKRRDGQANTTPSSKSVGAVTRETQGDRERQGGREGAKGRGGGQTNRALLKG